jgi:hypothetical protein
MPAQPRQGTLRLSALTRLNWRALSRGDDRLFEAVKALKYREPLRLQADIFTIETALWFRYSLHQCSSQTAFTFDLIRIMSPFLRIMSPFSIYYFLDKRQIRSNLGLERWEAKMKNLYAILTAICVLLVGGISLAQVGQQIYIPRPNLTAPPVETRPDIRRGGSETRRVICQQDISCLRERLLKEETTSSTLRKQISQMTLRTGSQVTAYCDAENGAISRNTAGASEDCGYYLCAPNTGICLRRCRSVDDCNAPASCTRAGVCRETIDHRSPAGWW